MRDLKPKFIIDNGNLIIGKCTYHKELAIKLNAHDNIVGGGWYSYDRENNAFTFSKSSFDFGTAKIEDIKKAINEKKVFLRGMRRNISSKHKFFYQDILDKTTPLN